MLQQETNHRADGGYQLLWIYFPKHAWPSSTIQSSEVEVYSSHFKLLLCRERDQLVGHDVFSWVYTFVCGDSHILKKRLHWVLLTVIDCWLIHLNLLLASDWQLLQSPSRAICWAKSKLPIYVHCEGMLPGNIQSQHNTYGWVSHADSYFGKSSCIMSSVAREDRWLLYTNNPDDVTRLGGYKFISKSIV